MTTADVSAIVERYICTELIADPTVSRLPNDVRLVSDGIIDSLASLRLVAFIEETFAVSVGVDQVNAEHLDTPELIAALVSQARS